MNNFTKHTWLILISLVIVTSCKNVDSFEDVIYFTGTESSAVKRISTEVPTSIGLSLTASCKVENEVIADIKVDANKVDAYNQKEGTNYKLLPENLYQLSSSELKIEQGESTSKPMELTILNVKDFDKEVTYLLPVCLDKVQGGLSVLESSRTVYIVISKPLITPAANMGGRYYQIPFADNPNLAALTQISYEARVCVNQFAPYFPNISTVMGIEGHFCLRFGDVAIKPNQIQIAGTGVETTAPTEFTTGRWYHIAAVFDGVNVKIYIDGKMDVSKAATVPTINLTDWRNFYIGLSEGGRFLDGNISEVRVWKKALTPKEIVNNICGVNPLTDGLVAYWRFNEGEGRTVLDQTGNGWDISDDVSWMQGVRCPGE